MLDDNNFLDFSDKNAFVSLFFNLMTIMIMPTTMIVITMMIVIAMMTMPMLTLSDNFLDRVQCNGHLQGESKP